MAYPPAGSRPAQQPPQPWPSTVQQPQPAVGGGKVRPQLPRFVDQMRILLWFQFFLTLVLFLAVLIGIGTISDAYDDSFEANQQLQDHLFVLLLLLLGTTLIQALSAGLVRRGWAIVAPLILLSQVAVVVDLFWSLWIGTFGAFGATLLVLLGGWILADLFRGEVRRYLLG